MPAKSEQSHLAESLVEISKRKWARVWRNNTGALVDKRGRLVRFGLTGSSDGIGLRAVVITPEMVGMTIGQFVALETKREGYKQTDAQKKFQLMVQRLGGLYILSSSKEETIQGIEQELTNDAGARSQNNRGSDEN